MRWHVSEAVGLIISRLKNWIIDHRRTDSTRFPSGDNQNFQPKVHTKKLVFSWQFFQNLSPQIKLITCYNVMLNIITFFFC